MGAGIAYCAVDILANYYTSLLGSRIASRLAARVAEHAVLTGSPDASERALALSLASSDSQYVSHGLISLFDLILAPFWFAAVILLLVVYSNKVMPMDSSLVLGAIATALTVCFGAALSWISVLLTRIKKQINAAENKQVSVFVECLENIRTLRFYGWDGYMLQKLHKMTDAMLPLRQRLLVLKTGNIAISFLASPFMSFVLLLFYAYREGNANHSINMDIYFAVASMFDLIKYPMLLLPNAIRAASGASASYSQIYSYFNLPAFNDQRESCVTNGCVELIDFPVGPTVVKEWSVAPGSLWILQGPVNSFKVCGRNMLSSVLFNICCAEHVVGEYCWQVPPACAEQN
jgi:ABC-type bacteriocin/lantibiotic exporter with double-glycine peptidase domain